MGSREHGHGGTAHDSHLVIFVLDGRRYAVPLRQVERVVRAVEVTPLPEAPPYLQGAVSVEGRALPVLNVRRRFGLPERPVAVSDHFVIVEGSGTSMILPVDDALGSWLIDRTAGVDTAAVGGERDGGRWAAAGDVTRVLADCVQAVVTDEQGIVFVLDLDRVMSAVRGGSEGRHDLEPASLG